MAQTVLEPAIGFTTVEAPPPPEVRRMQVGDLTTHGWMYERIAQFMPSMHPLTIKSYMSALLYSPEYLFLFMPHAVGLAQINRATVFEPHPSVMERFVLCLDPSDEGQQAEALEFYSEMLRWARNNGADRIFVLQHSDVPQEAIEKKYKRNFFSASLTYVQVPAEKK